MTSRRPSLAATLLVLAAAHLVTSEPLGQSDVATSHTFSQSRREGFEWKARKYGDKRVATISIKRDEERDRRSVPLGDLLPLPPSSHHHRHHHGEGVGRREGEEEGGGRREWRGGSDVGGVDIPPRHLIARTSFLPPTLLQDSRLVREEDEDRRGDEEEGEEEEEGDSLDEDRRDRRRRRRKSRGKVKRDRTTKSKVKRDRKRRGKGRRKRKFKRCRGLKGRKKKKCREEVMENDTADSDMEETIPETDITKFITKSYNMSGSEACQYHNLEWCYKRVGLVGPGTVHKCRYRTEFLECMEEQRTGPCDPNFQAQGDMKALRNRIRQEIWTTDSCLISEVVEG